MEATILLNASENTKLIEDQESSRFVRSVLESAGIDLSEVWIEEELTLDQKVQLRHILSQYQIQIIEDGDGSVEIFLEKESIAKWHKPTYVLKHDHSQLDPKDRLYLEMKVKYSTAFDKKGSND